MADAAKVLLLLTLGQRCQSVLRMLLLDKTNTHSLNPPPPLSSSALNCSSYTKIYNCPSAIVLQNTFPPWHSAFAAFDMTALSLKRRVPAYYKSDLFFFFCHFGHFFPLVLISSSPMWFLRSGNALTTTEVKQGYDTSCQAFRNAVNKPTVVLSPKHSAKIRHPRPVYIVCCHALMGE